MHTITYYLNFKKGLIYRLLIMFLFLNRMLIYNTVTN